MRDADGSTAAAAAAAAAAGVSAGQGFAGAPPRVVAAPVAEAPRSVLMPRAAETTTETPAIPMARVAAEAAATAAAAVSTTPTTIAAAAPPPGPAAKTASPPSAVATAPAPQPVPPAEAAPSVAAPPVAPVPQPAAPAPRAVPVEAFKTLVYRASGLRKTVLSFLFMLLLPFYGSLGPMFLQRLGKVEPLELGGFLAMAAAFTLLMMLLLFELMVSIRSRVTLGPKTIKFTLPARGGLVPAFSYVTHEVPYDEIDHVEIRREIYGGRLAPVLMRGARIVTRDGQKIPLGYVSEANEDAVIPFPEIATELCRRVGREPLDRGSVRRTLRKKFFKLAASAEENVPLSDAEIASCNRGHNRLMIGLVACLLLLLTAGIARDVMTATADHGERAANVTPKAGGRT